ncbi:S1C family serine protease [Gallintestinimicrobium propionicum]|uniref:S1C family serine protease n=1 Tax=Gallintestinimicrobium propionicum TaxID=2981770 RepID=UPI0032C15EEE
MYENENQSFDNREQDYHYTNTPEQQAPTRPRKKNTNAARIAKKAGAIALSAVLFGGVASGTFLGVNYAAGYRNNASTAASSESASASSQTASSSSSLLKATTPVSTGSAASSGSLDVSSVAESVMPSIVSITNKSVQEVQNYFSMFGYGGQAQEVESTSVGSGIIIGKNDTELLIVTNNHVVEGADTLSASFIDNSVYEATIKGTDSDNDLAVIAVPLSSISDDTMSQITVAAVGDSDSLKVGEQVVAIGNALGYGQSVTTGIVSATDRTLSSSDSSDSNALISSTVTTKETPTYIQTDAAINPGNSGGALVNMKGEVIGINSAKLASTEVEGMGYAIPITRVSSIIEELMNETTRTKVADSQKSSIGIAGITVDSNINAAYGIPAGVYVASVTPGSGAEAAGIRKGDVITKFDGKTVSTIQELKEKLQYYAAGEAVSITVQSPGEGGIYTEKELTITLSSAQSSEESQSTDNTQAAPEKGNGTHKAMGYQN